MIDDKIQFADLLSLFTKYHNDEYKMNMKNMYLLLLSELTVTEEIEKDTFETILNSIYSSNGHIIIGYIGNPNEEGFEIVCTGTIIIEPKIIRGGKMVGHIEDVVVCSKFRNQGISQILLNKLKDIAREKNCYKIILNCDECVKSVYIKNGFIQKGCEMAIYYV